MTDRFEAQLSALALIQAHIAKDIVSVTSILFDTPSGEMHIGMVYLLESMLNTTAASQGTTPQDVIDAHRAFLLFAAGQR